MLSRLIVQHDFYANSQTTIAQTIEFQGLAPPILHNPKHFVVSFLVEYWPLSQLTFDCGKQYLQLFEIDIKEA